MAKQRLLTLDQLRVRYPASCALRLLVDQTTSVSEHPGVLGIWIVDPEQTASNQSGTRVQEVQAYIACVPSAFSEQRALIAQFGEQTAQQLGWRLLAVIATTTYWEVVWKTDEDCVFSPS